MNNYILDEFFEIKHFNFSDYIAKYKDIVLQELDESVGNFLKKIAKDTERLYMFSTKGIGDFIIVGGLSYAVQQRKKKKSTVLVIQDKKFDTGILFPNVTGIIQLSATDVKKCNGYFVASKNYEGNNYLYPHFHHNGDKYIYDLESSMLDIYKKDMLIPPDTPFVYPIINEISEENADSLRQKYILDKERTIILLPHAITFKLKDKNFWIKMAQRLMEKNYIVYTNVAGNEKPIENTEPINVTFAELNFITNKVKCFIGLNSGAFVFLAMTDAKIFSITPFPQWQWDISIMFPESDNRTFYDEKSYNDVIKAYFKKFDVSVKIKFTNERIPEEIMFKSYEELLEAILSEVEKN